MGTMTNEETLVMVLLWLTLLTALTAWAVFTWQVMEVHKQLRVGEVSEAECDASYLEGESRRARAYDAMKAGLPRLNGVVAALSTAYIVLVTGVAGAVFWQMKAHFNPKLHFMTALKWWLLLAVSLGVWGMLTAAAGAPDVKRIAIGGFFQPLPALAADAHPAVEPPMPQTHIALGASAVLLLLYLNSHVEDPSGLRLRGALGVLLIAALLAVVALSTPPVYNAAVAGYEALRRKLQRAHVDMPATQQQAVCASIMQNFYLATGQPGEAGQCRNLLPRYLEHNQGREMPSLRSPQANQLRERLKELRRFTDGTAATRRWVGWCVAVTVALVLAGGYGLFEKALRFDDMVMGQRLRVWVLVAIFLGVVATSVVGWLASVGVFA